MSLLHGLAERALGAAKPVRSQRARTMRGLPQESAIDTAPVSDPIESTLPAPPTEAARPWHPQSVAAPAAREAETSIDADALIAPRAALRTIAPDVPPSPRAATRLAHAAEATPNSRPKRSAAQDTAVAAARLEAPTPDPAPLVARATPPPSEASMPTRLREATTPRRERQAAQAARAATSPPTEVHVSIGRVELTALPSASPPRAARAREAAGARGLGDYLRGSRDRS